MFEGTTTRTWSEIEEDCGRALAALSNLPGNQVFRWHHPEIRVALPVALALLHLSVRWTWDPHTPPLPSSLLEGKTAPRALLQRLTRELRPRDPACELEAGLLTHGALSAWAHGLSLPETELLVTRAPLWAALASVVSGTPIRVSQTLEPALGWWTDAASLDALNLPPPRLGGLGALTRSLSPTRSRLGPLQKVWVWGSPVTAPVLRQRGIEVIQIVLPKSADSGYPEPGMQSSVGPDRV